MSKPRFVNALLTLCSRYVALRAVPSGTILWHYGVFLHVPRYALNVVFQDFRPFHQAGQTAGVARSVPTDRFRRYVGVSRVSPECIDKGDDVLHVWKSAIRHRAGQVPIDLLIGQSTKNMLRRMESNFRHALLWHMDREGTTIAELSRNAGVSSDIIKKLRTRENSSTNAEVASKIAAFYGKTLDQFMQCGADANEEESFIALLGLLSKEERAILVRQVRGMIAGRDLRSKS